MYIKRDKCPESFSAKYFSKFINRYVIDDIFIFSVIKYDILTNSINFNKLNKHFVQY